MAIVNTCRVMLTACAMMALGINGAAALTEAEMRDCDSLEPGRMIRGCTAVISEPRVPQELRALALLKRGFAYFADKKLDLAIADFEASRTLNQRDIVVYNELGLAYAAKADYPRALATYEAGLTIKPDHSDIYFNRGHVHFIQGHIDRAIADYAAAVRLGPTNRVAHFDGGVVQELESARIHINYYRYLALAYHASGNKERTFATYDEAIQRFPKQPLAYVNRAAGFSSIGDMKRSLADFDQAIALDPKQSIVFGTRAFARFQSGDFEGSAADYAMVWSLDPTQAGLPKEYVPIWHFLALARSNPTAAKAALAERMVKIDQSNWPFPVVKMFMGVQPANQIMEQAKTPDERCEASFYLGQWHLLNGDKSAARTALNAAFATCPKTFFEYRGAEAELKRMGQ